MRSYLSIAVCRDFSEEIVTNVLRGVFMAPTQASLSETREFDVSERRR